MFLSRDKAHLAYNPMERQRHQPSKNCLNSGPKMRLNTFTIYFCKGDPTCHLI